MKSFEIEQIEGRKRFLENQSSLSTIKATLQTPAAISGSSKGFVYRLTDAVSTGLDGAFGFVLFFVTLLIAVLPFLLLVVLPVYLVVRYVRKQNRAADKSRPRPVSEVVREELNED